MYKLKRAARHAFVYLACVFLSGALQVAHAEEKKYGKTLVAEYEVPEETIEKYAAFSPSEAQKGESAISNVLLADSVDWTAPELEVDSSANPYNVVVKLSGRAIDDGDAATMWQIGWSLEDGMTRSTPLAGLSKPRAKAGESLSLEAASVTSFKEDRTVAAVLGLVKASNIEIEAVKIEVWTGVGETSWIEAMGAFHWALVGAVMLVLVWFWGRPKSASGT